MIETVLPPGVAHAETFGDVADAVLLSGRGGGGRPGGGEATPGVRHRAPLRPTGARTASVCPRRRCCPGERGAPQWPAGVVGSMTHCAGYRAAAVARATTLWTLGIDAEPHDALPAGVLPLVSLAAERELLARLAAERPGVRWDRLLFCAKEAVYKAWFPLARRWLDFEQAAITLTADGRVSARLLIDGPVVAGAPVTGFTGRWLVERGLAVVAVAMPVDHATDGVPAP